MGQQKGKPFVHVLYWKKKSLKIFSITNLPISIKLGTNHSWVNGIQNCSNKRLNPL
jgi:hypothetical protein